MPAGQTNNADGDAGFIRVRGAFDLAHLAACRVVCIGTGGAAGFIEDLARCGIGQFALVDPDSIELPNIARQMVYRRDLGRHKVAALAERLAGINPAAAIRTCAVALDDLDDAAMCELLRDAWIEPSARAPALTLLCGLTDNFAAQARVNRLALHFGVPSLCAQIYREGRGGEITFTFPGITPACHRCMLRQRYEFYASGATNPVTSGDSPIFAEALVNALKGYVALALLHHGTGHHRWGAMLSQIADRNLIQLRLDPHIATTLGLSTFERVFATSDRTSLFFGEPVWRMQAAEPDCPDCSGGGDLRRAAGRFHDTRQCAGAAPDFGNLA